MLEAARPPDPGSRRLLHMSFANYAAGAIIMPYGKFLRAAEEHRYAIDRLCAQFGANVEQVAHRLTTLSRTGANGVPFFMLRVDPAGNISKRYAGESFPFSHFGGTCPRWHLHAAFQTPGQTIRQLIETPDGQRFFTISRTIERPIRPDLRDDALLAIGLGCDVKHAGPYRLCRRPRSVEHAGDAGRTRLLDLPAAPVRLPRDAAGRADAGRRGKPEVDFALPVRAELGRDGLPLERGAIPLRKVGCGLVGRLQELAEHLARDRPKPAPRHRAGRTRQKSRRSAHAATFAAR